MSTNVKKKMKRKTAIFLAGLLALIGVVGVWMYYTNTSSIDNLLHTKDYGNRTIEEFTPEEDWEPGETITKTVGVENTGDYPLVVRVKFDEKWLRGGTPFVTIGSTTGISGTSPYIGWIDDATKSGSLYTAIHGGTASDGLVAGDHTMVYKNLVGILGGSWEKGADGWYYYKSVLGAGASTSQLLDSITLASNVDLGAYISTTSYSITAPTVIAPLKSAYDTAYAAWVATPNATTEAAKDAAWAAYEAAFAWTTTPPASGITYQKTETSLDPSLQGYANADYTLTITTEVIQATSDAVAATWTTAPTSIVTGWGL
jgi:alternate signal-mediated exported protein